MPKQNRPFARDGRLQAKKKRTDRSYLRPTAASTAVEETPLIEPVADGAAEAAIDARPAPATPAVATAGGGAAASGEPRRVAGSAAPAAATAAGRLPTTVRAMQQQGVRKRREFDVQALAMRDSAYALHELRRIFILASMVVITLVVLWFVLR
ncbi:MAG: hypothetical protein KGK07_02085 [Chloroflexota bacterium]|nr:hypothetical protein [Chloroflexota bacterium]